MFRVQLSLLFVIALFLQACGQMDKVDTTKDSNSGDAIGTKGSTSGSTTLPGSTGSSTADGTANETGVDEPGTLPNLSLTWKGVILAGDNSINAFDNARKTMTQEWKSFGMVDANINQLSMKTSEQVGGVRATSAANLEKALTDLKVTDKDACMIFMTSHGTQSGFYLTGQPVLSPANLGKILDRTCGTRPTVLLVSACYSGVFIDPAVTKDNRIILTAARKDRTSFGCGVENQYTFWDTCALAELPKAKTWQGFYESTRVCVEKKEGGFTPSLPQAYIGAAVKDMAIFDKIEKKPLTLGAALTSQEQ